jgi:2-polyprenyl-6-methoxyphenol hydroxylase-like FAD-dependent oxidoreductase
MNDGEDKNVKCLLSVENEEIIDVIIVGCGIGGLVSALCLNRCGVQVRLYEQAESLEAIGFGLNLQPYCVKLLHELGLENEMDEIGVRTRRVLFYSGNGQYLLEDPRGLDGGYNWPMYSIHRGHFHQLLLRHVRQKLGQSSIKLSLKLVHFRSSLDYVEMDFVNTITGKLITDKSKLLIGADGINSSVRKILYPNEGLPIWRGLNIWRGITSVDKMYLDGRTMICMGNPDYKHLVIYPVNNNLINWAFVIRVSQGKTSCLTETPDWTNTGHIEDLLPLISQMKLDFIDIQQLVKSSINVNQFPLTDRDLLSQWTFDRVTLLGDAAHPMYPNGGNGASQAILDAKQLYISFVQYGITNQALQSYENIRRPQTNQFVLAAREYGPDKILKIVDERSPNLFNQLSDVISSTEIKSMILNYKQMSGWNAQLLNKEPSTFLI